MRQFFFNKLSFIFFFFFQDKFRRDRRQVAESTSDSDGGREGGRDGDDTTNDTTSLIYFITPTYPRREQVAELTRLGQTLMHVPRLYWIVADDRPDCSRQIMNLLPDFGENFFFIAIFKASA